MDHNPNLPDKFHTGENDVPTGVIIFAFFCLIVLSIVSTHRLLFFLY